MMRGTSFAIDFGGDAALLSNRPPDPEAVTPAAGQSPQASRDDHVHPRLTSSHSGLALGSNGMLTIAFTRSFTAKPAIVMTAVQPGTPGVPVILEVVSFVQTGALYTGCVIRGYKGQMLPGTLTLLNALVNYNVFAAPSAGTEFTLVAVQTS